MKKEFIKNGFTLIELLAVLVLISIIAAVAVVNISAQRKSSNLKIFETQKDMIVLSAKGWSSENISKLPPIDGATINVTLEELLNDGYLEKAPRDARVNKKMKLSSYVVIKKNKKVFDYIFDDSTIEVEND